MGVCTERGDILTGLTICFFFCQSNSRFGGVWVDCPPVGEQPLGADTSLLTYLSGRLPHKP